ncbi:hypothetical protein HDE_05633 [Halotydeus destructor]|nr:hypothetical protein HDE_05633 [Halotydeus destructor]
MFLLVTQASQRVRAVYFSTGNNLTLRIYLPPGRAFYEHSLPFSLFLMYRVVPAKNSVALMASPDSLSDFGQQMSGTYCDRIYEDCLPPKRCKIRSPNYPGFFLRNVTCSFLVRQKRIPRGYRPRITISQSNEYKISLYSGSSVTGPSSASSTSMGKANRGLQSDCSADVVRIHDGLSSTSPKLAQLCGSGHLPPIVASQPSVLVTLESVSDMVMYDSRVELDIEISLVLIQLNETLYSKANICDQHFTADKLRSGIVASPSHTIPSNTSCTYTFSSSVATDRVWMYFASYYVPDLTHWNSEERCSANMLEIFGVQSHEGDSNESLIEDEFSLRIPHQEEHTTPMSLELQQENAVHNGSSSTGTKLRFCEKSSPRVCGRAADSPRYLPSIACTYPEESYLSSGPHMTMVQHHFKSNNLYSAGSNFVARFEFVDTRESGNPVDGTLCDRFFNSADAVRGDVRSSRNAFLFGRGGRSNVTCSYRFIGQSGQRLQLNLTSFRLSSTNCRHSIDPASGVHVCRARYSGSTSTNERTPRLATLVILDTTKTKKAIMGCFCSGEKFSHDKPLTFDLSGSEVIVNLTVTGMTSLDDYNDFSFEAKYEFLPALLISKALGNVLLLLLLLCYCFALSICCVRVALPSKNRASVMSTNNGQQQLQSATERSSSCECVAFKQPSEICAVVRPIIPEPQNLTLNHHYSSTMTRNPHHHRPVEYWPASNFYA